MVPPEFLPQVLYAELAVKQKEGDNLFARVRALEKDLSAVRARRPGQSPGPDVDDVRPEAVAPTTFPCQSLSSVHATTLARPEL